MRFFPLLALLGLLGSASACAHGAVRPARPATGTEVALSTGASFDIVRGDHLSLNAGLDLSRRMGPRTSLGLRLRGRPTLDRSSVAGFLRWHGGTDRTRYWLEVSPFVGGVRYHLSVPQEWAAPGTDFFARGLGIRAEAGFTRDRLFLAPGVLAMASADPRAEGALLWSPTLRFGAHVGASGTFVPQAEIHGTRDDTALYLLVQIYLRHPIR